MVTLQDQLVKKGIPIIKIPGVSQFCNTEYGFYRKLRWLILIREIFLIVSLFVFYKAKKVGKF